MTRIAQIDIHQTLHGYQRGHRLLASSRELSPEAERQMRLKSDYTGSSFQPGFESYLSAYTLEEESCVVLARTWYAKEMPRPGCVWTHSLLLPYSFVNSTSHFGTLLRSFQKPNRNVYRGYEKPISPDDCCHVPHFSPDVGGIARVIEALYTATEKPLFLVSDSAREYEELVLSLWSQQWPGLRRRFAFCTGFLELRGSEHLVDLHVIPRSDTRLVRAGEEAGTVVDPDANIGASAAEWALQAARDLASNGTAVSSFLQRFTEESRSRSDFQRYGCILGLLTATPPDPKNAAQCVAEKFSGSADSLKLKLGAFGAPGTREYFVDIKDIEMLAAVAETDSNAFPPDLLDIPSRFQQAWTESREKAMGLLRGILTAPSHCLYGSFIDAAAQCLDERAITDIATWNSDVMISIVRRNTRLATSTEIWRNPTCSIGRFADEFRESVARDSSLACGVLRAQVLADRTDQAKQMESILGERIVPFVLDAGSDVATRIDEGQLDVWLHVFRKYSDATISWLETRQEAPNQCDVLAGRGLGVGAGGLSHRVVRIWQRLCAEVEGLSERTRLHALLVALAAAFDDGSAEAEACCQVAFPPVYEAALSNQLPDDEWHALRGWLPRVGWEWDRCRPLRAGLIEYCVRHNWSESTVIRCSMMGNMLDQIFATWGWDRREKQLLKATAARIIAGGTEASDAQVHAADQFLSSSWM